MSDSNRERLIQAGIDQLPEKTFSEITMDQVAELSGVSKPMIYYYFKNKEGYYRALASYLLEMARSITDEFFSRDLPLREALHRYAQFRIEFARENPGISRAFMSVLTDPNIGLLIDELQTEFNSMRLGIIEPLFNRAIERGEIVEGTNGLLTFMILNSTLVSITMKMLNDLPCEGDIEPPDVVDILFDGIATGRKNNAGS